MKSKLLATLGLVAMITASNVVGVFASELEVADTANSSATVSFKDGDGTTTPPVDPENPDENIDPDDEDEDGGQTGHNGALRIDYVPVFKFGSNKIVSGEKRYSAELIKVSDYVYDEVPNFVQVSDLRGNGAGWELSVKQNCQFAVEGEADKVLAGADIVLSNITPNTVVTEHAATAPNSVVTVNADNGDQKILIAEENKGMGTHVAYFGNLNENTQNGTTAADSVELVIPDNVMPYADEYKTTLTWTLSSVPGEDA